MQFARLKWKVAVVDGVQTMKIVTQAMRRLIPLIRLPEKAMRSGAVQSVKDGVTVAEFPGIWLDAVITQLVNQER